MSKEKKIEIGQHFGRLTVLRKISRGLWECECSCDKHTILSVRGCELISKNKRSCGCLYHEARIKAGKKSLKDLTGQRFGKLFVVKRVDNIGKYVAYECKCDCGNTKIFKASALRGKEAKSCGMCEKDVSPVNPGDVFGSWTVNYLLKKNNRRYANITCMCGKTKDMVLSNLRKLRNAEHVCHCFHKGINLHNLVGEKSGKLTVIEYAGMGKFHSMWKCKCECGNEVIVPNCSIMSKTAKSCGGCTHTSFEEEELREFCNQISDYKFLSNRTILDRKEIDLYNDELKLGIEYNGSLFHSSVNSLYNDKSKYFHRDKFLLAKEKGVHLINIFDVDLIEKEDKIKNYIKELCTSKIKIYARDCEIRKLDKKVAHDFCENYHLQGHSYTDSIFYGLYYNDELLSVMTFGIRRYHKEDKQFELYRYVTKYGYTIVGGASKLLKHFEQEYLPQILISYSDNDYFSGSLYEKLGFVYNGQCSVSYYWFLNKQKISREQCQVKKLKEKYPLLYEQAINNNASNKEDYIMSKLGACKVYRSGNTKWIKSYLY